jgi:hypothetical protein
LGKIHLSDKLKLLCKIITFQFKGAVHFSILLLLLSFCAIFIFRYQNIILATINERNSFLTPAIYFAFFCYSDILLRALFQDGMGFNPKPYLILHISKRSLANIFYWMNYMHFINFTSICFVISFGIYSRGLLPGNPGIIWRLSAVAFTLNINILFSLQKLLYPAISYTFLLGSLLCASFYWIYRYTTIYDLLGNWVVSLTLLLFLITSSVFFREQIIKHLYLE